MRSGNRRKRGGGRFPGKIRDSKALRTNRGEQTMWKKLVGMGATITTLMLGLTVLYVKAQDAAPPKAASEAIEPRHAYRVDFALTEIEDGRKINSRQYALNLNAGESDQLKVGTRVPVEVKQGEIQYLDVGTNIWCRL